MDYRPDEARYSAMRYNRCGGSGLRLPAVSLGLWRNFGDLEPFETSRAMILRAFDLGITHFDLANNYGPPPGAAETTFGRVLKPDLGAYRDEIIVSTKAGFLMWPGPYGEWGSRKNLLASLDQSLKRMNLEYVDIFYHHRPDPDTPLEETMGALDHIVRSGKALYVGISNYPPEQTIKAAAILRALGTPCLIHQASYNMFNRRIESGLLETLAREQIGCIAFSPLYKGLLTDKYLSGIPPGSRASKPHGFLRPSEITAEALAKIRRLNNMAAERGQTLAQMALAWVLRHPVVVSALIGASRVEQIEEAVRCMDRGALAPGEIQRIDAILAG